MSDLRFGRSETNIRMVRTFALVSDQVNITCTFTCMSLKEHSLSRVTGLGVVSVDAEHRNETQCNSIGKFIYCTLTKVTNITLKQYYSKLIKASIMQN